MLYKSIILKTQILKMFIKHTKSVKNVLIIQN